MAKIFNTVKNIINQYNEMNVDKWDIVRTPSGGGRERWASVCGAGRAIIFKVKSSQGGAEIVVYDDTPKGPTYLTFHTDKIFILSQKSGDGCAIKFIDEVSNQTRFLLIYDKMFEDENGDFDYEKGFKTVMKKIETTMKDMK